MPIDGYYCINLFERNDRMIDAKKVFDKYHLPVKFYHVHKDQVSAKRGCFNSHLAIIKEAAKKKQRTIMIFEDDVTCAFDKETFDKKMQHIQSFIENYDYDIFYAGSIPYIYSKPTIKIFDNIYKVSANATHAYILSNSGIQKYKNLVFEDKHIDEVYRQDNKAYAYYPSLFYQSDSPSDNAFTFSLLYGSIGKLTGNGALKNYTQLREHYAMNIGVPLSKLILIILIIAVIVFIKTKNIIFAIIAIASLLLLIYMQ